MIAPGEIAENYFTDPASRESDAAIFTGEGFAWWVDDVVAIVASFRADVERAIEWAQGRTVVVWAGSGVVTDALTRADYRANDALAFTVDMRCATDPALPWPELDHYRVRSARDGDDLVGVHRASWRPRDLPFVPGRGPTIDPNATSSFDEATLAALTATWPYDPALHLVVEADDGSLAGSTIVWMEPTTGVAAIEPLGVVPAHRRRGVATALTRAAVVASGRCGAREVLVHARGDDAYPAPRGAYRAAGFSIVAELRRWTRGAALESDSSVASAER